jgi:hypothetical protein
VLHDVRLRVGALPKYPVQRPQLQPHLEHRRGHQRILRALRSHRRWPRCAQTRALEECEAFSLDGVTYEAFNTSGGLGTLCETLAGKVRNLNYRTIRYPGHAAIMKALLNDLRLRDRRDLLKDILEHAVPATLQDVVIVFVTVSGLKGGPPGPGDLRQQDLRRDGSAGCGERHPDHHRLGDLRGARPAGRRALPRAGFVRQEEIALTDFLANRFGRAYASAETGPRLAAASLEAPLERHAGTYRADDRAGCCAARRRRGGVHSAATGRSPRRSPARSSPTSHDTAPDEARRRSRPRTPHS